MSSRPSESCARRRRASLRRRLVRESPSREGEREEGSQSLISSALEIAGMAGGAGPVVLVAEGWGVDARRETTVGMWTSCMICHEAMRRIRTLRFSCCPANSDMLVPDTTRARNARLSDTGHVKDGLCEIDVRTVV